MTRRNRRTLDEKLSSILEGSDSRARAPTAPKEKKPRKVGSQPNLLITGVSNFWGERLALSLETNEGFGQIHGIDVRRPRVNFGRTRFTHLDVRSPMILDFLHSRNIETVVHLQEPTSRNPEKLFQQSVMNTMFLLSACADADVRNVILKSETAVYGFRPGNPMKIREGQYLTLKQDNFLDRTMGKSPHLVNLIEIEKYVHRFRNKHPHLKVLSLRFAPILGPRCKTWMTDYLREPVIPTALGFDPLVQLIHEDDVVRALAAATKLELDGAINVAAPGILTLHQLIRRMGKTSVPFARPLGNLWRRIRRAWTGGTVPAPLGMESLKFPCIGDLTRMREEFQFEPRKSAAATLDHFSEHMRMARYYHEEEPVAVYGKYTEEALKAILAEGSLGMGENDHVS